MKTVSLFKFLSLIVMISLALSACSAVGGDLPVNYTPPVDGEMIGLRPQTVLYGIKMAMEGKPGAEIWFNGQNNYVVMWVEKYGAMLFTYDTNTRSVTKNFIDSLKTGGSLMNMGTAEDLKTVMIKSGYKIIDPSEAPQAMKNAANNVHWLAALYGAETAIETLPTFIFMFVDTNLFCDNSSTSIFAPEVCKDYNKS